MAGATGPSPGQRGLTKKAVSGSWAAPGAGRAAGTLQRVCSEGTAGQLKENGCEACSLKTEETWDRRHKQDKEQAGKVLSAPIRLKPLCQRFTVCFEAGFPERHRKASVCQRCRGSAWAAPTSRALLAELKPKDDASPLPPGGQYLRRITKGYEPGDHVLMRNSVSRQELSCSFRAKAREGGTGGEHSLRSPVTQPRSHHPSPRLPSLPAREPRHPGRARRC